MLVTLTLFALIGASLSASLPEGKPVDNTALFTFAMVGTQRAQKDVSMLVELGANGLDELNLEEQVWLLESGGLSPDAIDAALEVLLPKLKEIGRTSDEQAMALLMLAQKFCYKTKDGENECYGDEKEYLALTAFKSTLGCTKKDITSWGLDAETRNDDISPIAEDDLCMCFDQTDPMLWLALVNKFSGGKDTAEGLSKHEQLIAILTELFNQPCEGYLKSQKEFQCSCNRTTEGHEALYMHVIMSEQDVLDNITNNAAVQEFMQKKMNRPSTRISSEVIMNFMLQSMGSTMDPMMLAYLTRDKTSGISSSEYLKQMILSSLGVDSSLAHLLLNGGLNSADTNKVAMINYMTASGALDPAFVPMMLGVQHGKSFYIESLVESGAVDPLVGLLLIGKTTGVDNSKLMEILIESVSSPNREEYLASIYEPYVPGLPAGIYPGSALYFAHFELLGVNTCALHDLRNRINCGYNGITAAECETAPYCCYSPIFLDDVTVKAVTGNTILSASAIPWCYYNIFFVLYDSYHMVVKTAGEFASPIACRGLFKYGLNIDATLYALLSASTTNPLAKYMIARTDCGFPGITEFHCVAIRGCCWDSKNVNIPGVPQCYNKNGDVSVQFSFSNIPAAYVPAPGSCNINRRQIRSLYYKRTACHYTFDFYKFGYNALSVPNRLDCLTRLGCCYEDDDSVAELYPFVPRCYTREAGGISGLSKATAHTLPRMGEDTETAIKILFPPHEKKSDDE